MTETTNRFTKLPVTRSPSDEELLEEYHQIEDELAVLAARQEDDLLDEGDLKNLTSEAAAEESGFWGRSVGR